MSHVCYVGTYHIVEINHIVKWEASYLEAANSTICTAICNHACQLKKEGIVKSG
jgi:hypothetical protein